VQSHFNQQLFLANPNRISSSITVPSYLHKSIQTDINLPKRFHLDIATQASASLPHAKTMELTAKFFKLIAALTSLSCIAL